MFIKLFIDGRYSKRQTTVIIVTIIPQKMSMMAYEQTKDISIKNNDTGYTSVL